MRARSACSRAGFSMIEVLVVIAVIALLLAILLPSLGAVRGTARTTVCRANMRSVLLMFAAYSGDHAGSIPGSPITSGWDCAAGPTGELQSLPPPPGVPPAGRTLVNGTPTYNGVAVQTWDWMGPVLYTSGISGPGERIDYEPGNTHDRARAERFEWYRSGLDFMRCPENRATATPFPAATEGEVWKTGPMLPFAVTTQFTSTRDREPFGTEQRLNDRGAYTPRDDLVGPSSLKALVFEGHRYARLTAGPDFHHEIDAPYGGAFGDTGPWYNRSKALDRSFAPGEPQRELMASMTVPVRDTRALGFRHNARPDGPLYGDVNGVVAFFDAHVEVMTDLEATNPIHWFPTGTKLRGPDEFWRSTVAAYPDLLSGSATAP